ncbi:sodium:solute symporter family protein [Oceanobacillus alkalisoli]|uniref:sodium:solute symporter family protein n=1 Tax=Oceanobacillus alkalisoli TaxID=2925113 RepID=UPI001F11DE58|nr:sodium:pantothenate symporter [Oceanobacillus alkalisoli]MCF3942113.1 sodium:pantothenate symporter [Oceanobacillus alkalisoli]
MLSTWFWIQLAIFILAMIAVIVVATKKTKTIDDFAISGANLGPVVLGLSFAATVMSAATFMGYPGYSHAWGFSNLWLYLSLSVATPIGFLTVGKMIRKVNTTQRSLSLPDWLGDYYNSDFLRVGSGLIMLFNLFYIAAQFSAGAQIFETIVGTSYGVGLVIIAVIVIAYVFVGGSYADIYTDAIQAMLMIIVAIIVFISGIVIFGDGNMNTAFTNITENFKGQDGNLLKVLNPESNYYAFSAVLGLFIIQFAFASQPQLFNKVLSLKKPQDLRKMFIVYIITTILCLLVLFGGFYSRVAVPELQNPDLGLLAYVEWGMPAFLGALVVVTILAAALSTTDGLFVVMSTVFANDIYRKFLVKRGIVKVTEEQMQKTAMRISRWAVIVVGVLACFLVLSPPPFLGDLMWIGISGVSAGTLGPIMYAVFSRKKASPRAAEASMIFGLVSYLIIVLTGIESSPLAAGGWATCVGIAVMVILANVLKRPDDQNG